MSDDLVFSDEQAEPAIRKTLAAWQVLVVDDEPAVHEVTKLVMSDFEMDGRPLEFTHCYSAAEARSVLATRNDIALILLDVVMESEHAGLDLARYIREDLGNLNVRIILRTGQPGQAPEEQVIRDYDINDYKEKTDLTRRKLITVFYAGLRAYRDLMRIEHARLGLRRSIEAISQVCDSRNLRGFASAVLEQVNFLLDLNGEGLCASRVSAYTANSTAGQLKVLAARPGPPPAAPASPGTVLLLADERPPRPAVATGDGTLVLDTVALEGKRPTDAADLARGYRDFVGAVLGG